MLRDPVHFAQVHLLWIIVIFALLFGLARLNNTLENQGVDRAIAVSRGVMNSLTAFIIAPIAFVLLTNLIAYIYGLPAINLSFIGEWIWVTMTSVWWIGKCIFGGAPLMRALYDGNSIVRIAWICLPLAFIWFRSYSTHTWRLMVIPVILCVLFVTKNREAPPTFLTPHLTEYFPAQFGKPVRLTGADSVRVAREFDNINTENLKKGVLVAEDEVQQLAKGTSRPLFLGIVVLVVGAVVMGFLLKKPQLGAVLALSAVVLYFMVEQDVFQLRGHGAAQRQEISDKLLSDFVALRQKNPKTNSEDWLRLNNMAIEINNAHRNDGLVLPDSFCDQRYRDFFFDYCLEKAERVK